MTIDNIRKAAIAARKAKRAELIKRFDANGDGRLEGAEKTAAKREMFSQRANRRFDRMLSRLDQNGDRALSQDEVANAQNAAQNASRRAQGPRKKTIEERFRSADQNGDGVVTRSEFLRNAEARWQSRQ